MRFEVTEYQIESSKIRGAEEISFVFLSDLHLHEFGEGNGELIEAIRRIRPDAVLSGGDMVLAKGPHSLEVPMHLLRALAGEFPVYAANGNHEVRMARDRDVYGNQWEDYREALAEAGCVLLSDESALFQKGEDRIRIWGVDLPKQYYRKFRRQPMDPQFLRERLGEPEKEVFQLLMAHSPNYPEAYEAWGADAVLSGHFHGGTIRLPVLGAVMSPDFEFFPRYAHGRFEGKDGCTMMVSSGLGTHSVNLRINDPPELIVLRVRRKKG